MTTPGIDRREQILARLQVCIKEVGYFAEVYRNKDAVPGQVRPAVIILDGNENNEDANVPNERLPTAVQRAVMTPEIYAFVDAATPEEIGPLVNVARSKILKAVLTDTALLAAIGANGHMRFTAFQSQLAVGQRIEAQCLVSITIDYVFKPGELP